MPYAEVWRTALEGSNLLARADPVSLAGGLAFVLLLIIGGGLLVAGCARPPRARPPPAARRHDRRCRPTMVHGVAAGSPQRRLRSWPPRSPPPAAGYALLGSRRRAAASSSTRCSSRRTRRRRSRRPPTARSGSPSSSRTPSAGSATGASSGCPSRAGTSSRSASASAPDGSAWYTDAAAGAIARMTPAGEVASFRSTRRSSASGGWRWRRTARLGSPSRPAYSITRLKDGAFTRHVFDSVRGGPYGVAVAPLTARCGPRSRPPTSCCASAPDGEMRAFGLPRPGAVPSDIAVGAGRLRLVHRVPRQPHRAVQGRPVRGVRGRRRERRAHRARGRSGRYRLVRDAAGRQPGPAARRQGSRRSGCPHERARPYSARYRPRRQRLVRRHQRLCRHAAADDARR